MGFELHHSHPCSCLHKTKRLVLYAQDVFKNVLLNRKSPDLRWIGFSITLRRTWFELVSPSYVSPSDLFLSFSLSLPYSFTLTISIRTHWPIPPPLFLLFLLSPQSWPWIHEYRRTAIGSRARATRSNWQQPGLDLSLIHIWRCRRSTLCRSRWSPYH